MPPRSLALALATLLGGFGLSSISLAGLHYSGQVTVRGQPFHGTGLFKFAVLDEKGTQLWNNDPSGSLAAVPTSEVRLSVSNGTYAVILDDYAGVQTLETALATQPSAVRLRIWFSDGTNAWQQLPPDQVINLKEIRSPDRDASMEANIERILSELRQIKVQLTSLERRGSPPTPAVPTSAPIAPTAPTPAKLAINSGGQTLGDPKAKVALIEFTDFQCGYCKKFSETTFLQLKTNYIDKGKLLFVSRGFPLDFHTRAKEAARAAICAGQQDKYFEFRSRLFAENTSISPELFLRLVNELNLDAAKFNTCTNNPASLEKIQKDLTDGARIGVTGTPTFVLGRITPDGQVDGQIIVGARPLAEFESKIDALLAGQK